jgi:hypothetical protein
MRSYAEIRIDTHFEERVSIGIVDLDIRVENDLISSRFAHEKLGLRFQDGMTTWLETPTDGNAIYSVGRIDGRWMMPEPPQSIWGSGSILNFQPRFFHANFAVVISDLFDVIIGRKSVELYELHSKLNVTLPSSPFSQPLPSTGKARMFAAEAAQRRRLKLAQEFAERTQGRNTPSSLATMRASGPDENGSKTSRRSQFGSVPVSTSKHGTKLATRIGHRPSLGDEKYRAEAPGGSSAFEDLEPAVLTQKPKDLKLEHVTIEDALNRYHLRFPSSMLEDPPEKSVQMPTSRWF